MDRPDPDPLQQQADEYQWGAIETARSEAMEPDHDEQAEDLG
jgi:hypothetical protein